MEENGSRSAESLLGDMRTFKVVVANADVIENGINGTNDGTNGISKEDRVHELMRTYGLEVEYFIGLNRS